ncbi:MAG: hypothetical protein J5U17_09310 [Candidatus Methanoperedens sp.]|nr:hypothetical protein [Candidatus Methanoperedens sp.]MCE8428782.1 hypothetical protein [Candidatus Methanoperedens sp.]
MDLNEKTDRDAQGLYLQLNKAMANHDMKAVSRAMRDFAGIGYSIQIMTRHVAKNGDRLEITSTLEKHNMIVNGRKHLPSILRYRKILKHLDDHPEDYGEYFFHKNELSPEDYSWMCINEEEEKRYGFNDKHC